MALFWPPKIDPCVHGVTQNLWRDFRGQKQLLSTLPRQQFLATISEERRSRGPTRMEKMENGGETKHSRYGSISTSSVALWLDALHANETLRRAEGGNRCGGDHVRGRHDSSERQSPWANDGRSGLDGVTPARNRFPRQ